ESVSRLSALHVNRPGQDVTAWTLVGDLFVDVAQGLLYLIGRKAGLLQSPGAIGDQGIEDHGVAGANVQHGWGRGVVVAPGHGLRRGRQRVLLRTTCRRRRLRYILGRNGDHERTRDKHRATHLLSTSARKMLPQAKTLKQSNSDFGLRSPESLDIRA